MIRGTESDCRIIETRISGTTAFVTCLIFSHKPIERTMGLRFFVVDSDGSEEYADECVYWLNGIGEYGNKVTDVDVRQYREILLSFDVTHGGKANLTGDRWSRRICLRIKPKDDPFSYEPLWESDWIDLISAPFEIPEIKSIGFRRYKDANGTYHSYIRFRNVYSARADFSVSNANTYTKVTVFDIATGEELESHETYVGDTQTSVKSHRLTQVGNEMRTVSSEKALQNGTDGEIEIELMEDYDNIVRVLFQTFNAKGEFLSGTSRYVDMGLSAARFYIKSKGYVREVESVSVMTDADGSAERYAGKVKTSTAMPFMKEFLFPSPTLALDSSGDYLTVSFNDDGFYDEQSAEIVNNSGKVLAVARKSGQKIRKEALFVDPDEGIDGSESVPMSINEFLQGEEVFVRTTYVKDSYIKIIEEPISRSLASMVAICSQRVLCSEHLFPYGIGEKVAE